MPSKKVGWLVCLIGWFAVDHARAEEYGFPTPTPAVTYSYEVMPMATAIPTPAPYTESLSTDSPIKSRLERHRLELERLYEGDRYNEQLAEAIRLYDQMRQDLEQASFYYVCIYVPCGIGNAGTLEVQLERDNICRNRSCGRCTRDLEGLRFCNPY